MTKCTAGNTKVAKGHGNISATYAFGTQGVEVEVDTETGEVKILRLVAAHDVGKVLHPQGLKGQIYGALAQGVGYTLYEELQTKHVERSKVLWTALSFKNKE